MQFKVPMSDFVWFSSKINRITPRSPLSFHYNCLISSLQPRMLRALKQSVMSLQVINQWRHKLTNRLRYVRRSVFCSLSRNFARKYVVVLWFFFKSKKNKVLQIFCEENRTKSHLLRLMEIFSDWKRSDLFVPTLFRDIDIVDFRMMQNWYHASRAFQKTTWRPPSVNFSWLGVSRKNEQTESTRSKSKQWFLWISQRWGSFIYCFHAWLHLLTRLAYQSSRLILAQ